MAVDIVTRGDIGTRLISNNNREKVRLFICSLDVHVKVCYFSVAEVIKEIFACHCK